MFFLFSSCQKDELKREKYSVIEIKVVTTTPIEIYAVLVSTSDSSFAFCDSIYLFDNLRLELTDEEATRLGSASYVSVVSFSNGIYIKDTSISVKNFKVGETLEINF